MPVRSTMQQIISKVRLMIGDTAPTSEQQFTDSDIQDKLDEYRDDIRYESLTIAPSIVNNANTNGQATTIFADFYSDYKWWEQDVVLQAYSGGQAWVVVTPVVSDYITGHWQFETNVFVSGTVPGQLPPVFATGKVYDLNAASADLLEFWAVTLTGAYDVSVDGQNLRRSQLMTQKLTMSTYYRKRAKIRTALMTRTDVMPALNSVRTRLLDAPDQVKGQ